MNIWCEFEDRLKFVFYRVHTVKKNKIGPLVATTNTNGWHQCTGKDPVQIDRFRAYTRKMKLAPQWPQMLLISDENGLES